jgi:hypothetical protein
MKHTPSAIRPETGASTKPHGRVSYVWSEVVRKEGGGGLLFGAVSRRRRRPSVSLEEEPMAAGVVGQRLVCDVWGKQKRPKEMQANISGAERSEYIPPVTKIDRALWMVCVRTAASLFYIWEKKKKKLKKIYKMPESWSLVIH